VIVRPINYLRRDGPARAAARHPAGAPVADI
jgi:hypothetical protein